MFLCRNYSANNSNYLIQPRILLCRCILIYQRLFLIRSTQPCPIPKDFHNVCLAPKYICLHSPARLLDGQTNVVICIATIYFPYMRTIHTYASLTPPNFNLVTICYHDLSEYTRTGTAKTAVPVNRFMRIICRRGSFLFSYRPISALTSPKHRMAKFRSSLV